jgi:hypothetical protein
MAIDPKQYRPSFLKDKLEADALAPRAGRATCIRCPNKLPPWVRYYCSGECMNEAKMDGTYGKEDALK